MKQPFTTGGLKKLHLNKKTVAYLALSDTEMKMMAGGNAMNFGTVPGVPDLPPTVNTSKMAGCTIGPTRPLTMPE